MLNLETTVLDNGWDEKIKFLKTGLLAGDIWDRNTGLSLSGRNANAAASALFNELTSNLDSTLSDSGFPELNQFYLLNLDDNKMAVVIRHDDDILEGWFLDPSKLNMGILFSVAIPKAITTVQSARA